MATTFTLKLVGDDRDHLQWVARKCFQRLDELEKMLSRFIPDSDISRINKLKPGQQLALDYETWDILKAAIEVHQWTQGAFDIGVGEHMNIFRATKKGILNEFEMTHALRVAQQEKEQARIFVDPEKPFFYCVKDGMILDLGGIGKGFALDQLTTILAELEVENYLLSAGDSTKLAKGNPTEDSVWQETLAAASESQKITLDNYAISASGTFYQGEHIFDPRTGTHVAGTTFDRVWMATKHATQSDALSTAAFVLTLPELETLAAKDVGILWIGYSLDGKIHFIK